MRSSFLFNNRQMVRLIPFCMPVFWLFLQVFQRRDGSIRDFHLKTWEEYSAGFGVMTGEFWLGIKHGILVKYNS